MAQNQNNDFGGKMNQSPPLPGVQHLLPLPLRCVGIRTSTVYRQVAGDTVALRSTLLDSTPKMFHPPVLDTHLLYSFEVTVE